MMIPNLKTMNWLLGAAALAAAPGASAGLQVDLYEDFEQWELATGGDYTTIDFADYPAGTLLSDQYEDLGIHFTEASHWFSQSWESYPNDGHGIDSNGPEMGFQFDSPMQSLAGHFPGGFTVVLYNGGEYLWHTSTAWTNQGSGHFEGLISSEPFDEVRFLDTFEFRIDDLHFGLPVPAPAGLPVLAFGLLRPRRRRASNVNSEDRSAAA